ncbi:hydroxyphenylpyruvate reductase-like [Castanea sativa]|uniref:hydroxyphenylpyruvate reductase-like n=1 Tax=Castanea sativa TaxID=21020 RepID=UPI003F64C871
MELTSLIEFLKEDSNSVQAIVLAYNERFDKIDLVKCKEKGIHVTNTPNVLTDDVADMFSGQSVGIVGLCWIGLAIMKPTTLLSVNCEVIDALGGPNGIIINVGQGPLIDVIQLVFALFEGRLGGAGLDMFENEPEVPEQLFGLENVVLLPRGE